LGDRQLSKLIETKAEFQVLTEQRLLEAKALLDLEKWDGAYYLAGYAVELALKACIIKMLMATDAFPKKDFSKDCYTHSIVTLIKQATLDDALRFAKDADPEFHSNWATANDWNEEKRYHRINKSEAEELYDAIGDGEHGVLPWIKTRW
jgi:HEPN domain-containing protein